MLMLYKISLYENEELTKCRAVVQPLRRAFGILDLYGECIKINNAYEIHSTHPEARIFKGYKSKNIKSDIYHILKVMDEAACAYELCELKKDFFKVTYKDRED